MYVVVLTNIDSDTDTDRVRPVVVAKKAAAVAIGNPYPDFRAVALDATTLATYAGDYKLNEKVSRAVRRDQDHLEVVRSGRPALPIYPLGGDRFLTKNQSLSTDLTAMHPVQSPSWSSTTTALSRSIQG